MYRVLGRPGNLDEFFDKARSEGENNIHIITTYRPGYRYSIGEERNEIKVMVRYFHGDKLREFTGYEVSAKMKHYKPTIRVKDIKSRAEELGFNVATVREKRNNLESVSKS